MNKKILLPLILALCSCLSLSAQQLAVKTNLLFWATASPNIGAELALSPHSTISFEASANPWTFGQNGKIQFVLVRPEYRYWITEKFTRFFIGAHLVGGAYKVGGFRLPFGVFSSFQNHYYKGWAAGAGITLGYHFYVSPHFNLELAAGGGYVRTTYSRYDLKGKKDRTTTRNLIGPTNASVTFVYLFNSRK